MTENKNEKRKGLGNSSEEKIFIYEISFSGQQTQISWPLRFHNLFSLGIFHLHFLNGICLYAGLFLSIISVARRDKFHKMKI